MLEQVSGRESPSLGDLFGKLSRELGMLVRQEMELAKTELSEKASRATRSGAMVGMGGAMAHAGALGIMAGIVLLLGLVIPLWAAALLVGVVVAGIGYGIIQTNLKTLKHIDPTPRQTLQTLKEDALWAKQQAQ